MSDSTPVIQDSSLQVSTDQDKLEDTVELLHLWKNEAYAYRHLVEMVISGRYTFAQAREALSKTYSLNSYSLNTCSLELAPEEREAFLATAKRSSLSPSEFLWACVESMMNSADDEYVLNGCREAAERRFKDGVLSAWVVGTANEHE